MSWCDTKIEFSFKFLRQFEEKKSATASALMYVRLSEFFLTDYPSAREALEIYKSF